MSGDDGVVLITGGAGFVGCNVAAEALSRGGRVRVLDNLSRHGVRDNLQWLRDSHGERVETIVADIASTDRLDEALENVDAVYHFAAQVAVTTSLEQPDDDFRTNLLGTFRLLEAVRRMPRPASLVFASTNKVYGNLAHVPLEEEQLRYASPAMPSVDERQALDFHTPYGCSKGGAEQYVLDYARTFGLSATALRMSCIYGPHQCGTEDQGWVAHFLIQALRGEPIYIYGDGKQVRDILFVDDLVAAQRAALVYMDQLRGKAWNVGGGIANSVSLLEILDLITEATGRRPDVQFREPRAGDQKYYVSDVSAFGAATGWSPGVSPPEGVARLGRWFRDYRLLGPEPEARHEQVAGGR
jgi:CDP-paratose 2-epimerase